MKTTRFYSLALAALMLGACSDVTDLNENGQGAVLDGENGFVSFSINLPTQPSSRANDMFDDGVAAEYAVKDATLLIFVGNNEEEATFHNAYKLTGLLETPDYDNDNITSSYNNIAASILKPSKSGNLYALVMLNSQNVLTQDASSKNWSLMGTPLTETVSFDDVRTAAQTFDDEAAVKKLGDIGESYFFMTNAPLCDKPGGAVAPTGGTVTTLVELDKSKIFNSKEKALKNPAGDIFVERAVAKVTVKNSSKTGEGGSLKYSAVGWTLDVMNKKSYIVRNVKGADWWEYKANGTSDYRFVGSVGTETTDKLYRTYWAKDPNYDTALDKTQFINKEENTLTDEKLTACDDNLYCLENTFCVDHQNQDETTRVVVAVDLLQEGADGTTHDFYILNDNKSKVYVKDGLDNEIKTQYLNIEGVKKLVEDNLKGTDGVKVGDYMSVKYDKLTTGGNLKVTEITFDPSIFKGNTVPDGLTDATNDANIASLNSKFTKIAYYKGGRAYYPVRIRHFDDAQTPWTVDDALYNGNEEDYLGRYGVLRNNWYQIDVKTIKEIGEAEVPSLKPNQDDEFDNWISVNISIFSWALRNQSVDL